jgi:hypothetical protein
MYKIYTVDREGEISLVATVPDLQAAKQYVAKARQSAAAKSGALYYSYELVTMKQAA